MAELRFGPVLSLVLLTPQPVLAFSEVTREGTEVRPNARAQGTAPGAGGALDGEGGPHFVQGRELPGAKDCQQDLGRNVFWGWGWAESTGDDVYSFYR